MPSTANSTLSRPTSAILCYYFNSTDKIQLIRLWNSKNYSLEKIVFPQQRILFGAKPEDILEVHTTKESEQLLESVFVCHNLQVKQSKPQLVA
ncbi:MAG: DUF1830 domain-containing protein [Cyanobacteria bacterium P01_A01_bin.40]